MTPEQEQLLKQLRDEEAKLSPEQKLVLLKELDSIVVEMNNDIKEFLSLTKDQQANAG